jgi:ribosomal protein S12 methylthiotransferase accessory factor
MSAALAAIDDVLDLVHDRRVGIIARLDLLPAEAGAPDFVHVAARVADPSVFGGERGPFTVAAAGLDRAAATARASGRALARYCAALYQRDGLPLATPAEATFRTVKPADFTLYSREQHSEPGFPFVPFEPDTPVRWASVIELTSGQQMFLPAAFVWFPFRYLRSGGDLPIAPVTASGLACGEGVADAVLRGLGEVVARDGLALFWQSRTAPPQVRVDSVGERLAGLVARFERSGDRLAILDIGSNHRLPCFAVVLTSDKTERPAYVFAAAAGIDPEAAIAEALLDLAEMQRTAQELRRRRPPPSSANDWEDVVDWRDHVNFAADPFNRELIAFMLSSEDRRSLLDYDAAPSGSPESDLENCVTQVKASGHEVYAANLTSEDVAALGLAVCRVVVPGYQPLFPGHRLRALGGTRLYEVPQKLGYRGIPRGNSGNTAPHPFACLGS